MNVMFNYISIKGTYPVMLLKNHYISIFVTFATIYFSINDWFDYDELPARNLNLSLHNPENILPFATLRIYTSTPAPVVYETKPVILQRYGWFPKFKVPPDKTIDVLLLTSTDYIEPNDPVVGLNILDVQKIAYFYNDVVILLFTSTIAVYTSVETILLVLASKFMSSASLAI